MTALVKYRVGHQQDAGLAHLDSLGRRWPKEWRDAMLELLEQQKRLTLNQKLIHPVRDPISRNSFIGS